MQLATAVMVAAAALARVRGVGRHRGATRTPRGTCSSASTTRRRRSTGPIDGPFATLKQLNVAGDPRQPLLGRHARRRARRARRPDEPADRPTTGRSTTASSATRRSTASRSSSRSTARRLGERRQGPNVAPTKRDRPAELRLRGREALQRQFPDGRGRRFLPPVKRLARPGTSRTTRSSSRRSTSASEDVDVESAFDYAKICNAVYTGVHATLLAGRARRLRRHRAAGQQRPDSSRAVGRRRSRSCEPSRRLG